MSNQHHQRPRQRRTGQQPTGGGQSTGGSQEMSGQQPMPGGQGTGGQGQRSFEDHLTNELRIALEDFTDLSHVADWCAKMCASEGPQLATCAAICRDIAELAAFNEMLIARDSMFGPEIADAFVRIAREGLPELQQYRQRPHVAETISAIERAMDSCTTLLEMVGGGGETSGRRPMGAQQSGGQMGTGGRRTGRRSMGGQQPRGQR
ncbi:hypothetical protein HTG_09530 [Natrinema mahii]|nr:hypothetical protein HTG_09530 [Natrinema mahii]